MADERKDFFISYTSADINWATWIADVLETHGYSVVIQAWDFRPGGNFVLEMQRGLRSSDRVIAVLTQAYLDAHYTQPEWAAAFAKDPEGLERSLVPVMVEQCRPDAILSQIVWISLVGLSPEDAEKKLVEGVRPERAKPAERTKFPGSRAGAATMRPQWRSLSPGADIEWRSTLDGQNVRSGTAAVEVHMFPIAAVPRLPVTELARLADVLADAGRQARLFSRREALTIRADGRVAIVTSQTTGRAPGLAVTRSAQRSAWVPLPRNAVAAVLDESDLPDQIRSLLELLIGLPIESPREVALAVGLEPAQMITIGRVRDQDAVTRFGLGMPEYVRPAVDDSLSWTALTDAMEEVCAELAARLIMEYRRVARMPG